MDEFERVILVKSDVFIYRIPPRTSNRAHRASDWKLDAPDWNGRLRLLAKGKECILKLEEKASGQLFGKCPIDKYPSVAIEAVSDSSRYFVLRLQDDNGRSAFIGIGFSDRGDSFDLNVALQDHFKILEKEEEFEKQLPEDSKPMLDLGFKEGQTIKVNLNIAKKGGTSSNNSSRQRVKGSGTTSGILGLLPPPPSSGSKISAPPKTSSDQSSKEISSASIVAESNQNDCDDFLLQLDSLSIGSSANNKLIANDNNISATNTNKSNDLWSEFESSNNDVAKPISNSWAQF